MRRLLVFRPPLDVFPFPSWAPNRPTRNLWSDNLTFPHALLSAEQIAALIGCSAKTIKRHSAAGRLGQPVRQGRLLRWKLADVQRYLG